MCMFSRNWKGSLHPIKNCTTGDQSNRTEDRMFALHAAYPIPSQVAHLMPGGKHHQEWLLSSEPRVTSEYFQVWPTKQSKIALLELGRQIIGLTNQTLCLQEPQFYFSPQGPPSITRSYPGVTHEQWAGEVTKHDWAWPQNSKTQYLINSA